MFFLHKNMYVFLNKYNEFVLVLCSLKIIHDFNWHMKRNSIPSHHYKKSVVVVLLLEYVYNTYIVYNMYTTRQELTVFLIIMLSILIKTGSDLRPVADIVRSTNLCYLRQWSSTHIKENQSTRFQ